jgi:hypothetical protein
MGLSPAHRFGQILGEVLEQAVEPIVAAVAKKHDLYLDKKGPRKCRNSVLLSWQDASGNTHNLDFVLERGGSDEKRGLPAAFIEVAWRRYTKHSRAKAQEIQGAIMPLLEQHHKSSPFFGIVIAGVFTKPALQQLKSLGFSILFIPKESIVKAFAKVGVEVAADERTPDKQFKKQVVLYEKLSDKDKASLAAALLEDHQQDVKIFAESMDKVLSRQIERILVLPLYGTLMEFVTIEAALASMETIDQHCSSADFVRFEIEVQYDNGNTIRGKFNDKNSAIEFLLTYRPTPIPLTSGRVAQMP